MVRPQRRAGIQQLLDNSWLILTGYVRGSAVNAAVLSIALWILGIPLVIPMAILALFGSFIPVVGPMVMGRSVHLHPVAVIVGISTGTLAFGILGAFVAVPVVAILAAAIDTANAESEITLESGSPLSDDGNAGESSNDPRTTPTVSMNMSPLSWAVADGDR